jgi:uncharacterized protein (TIGR02265 family)
LARLAALLPETALERLQLSLVNPARGRYLAFRDYPQVDYSRLAHATAQELYRRFQVSEALRRLARQDIQTFAQSQIGKIMFALCGDAPSALMKLPEMYRAALRGGHVKSTRLGASRVSLEFRDFYGWLDCYPIGTVEGLVEHFARDCDIEVSLETDIAGAYVVHLK